MSVQNISGTDVITTNFTPEYSPKNEQIPTDQVKEVSPERPSEENKGNRVDTLA